MNERSLLAAEIRKQEEEERLSTLMESAQERMVEKIECDECGAKLPAIYDNGVLKVDTYHSCDVAEAEIHNKRVENLTDSILDLVNKINQDYRERRGLV